MKRVVDFPYWRTNFGVSVANRVCQRILSCRARTAQISAVMRDPVAANCLTPNLLQLSMQAIHGAAAVTLPKLNERMDAHTARSVNEFPGEAYRLLTALVEILRPQRVIDIGTYKGLSALTLSHALAGRGEVITFDVIAWDAFSETLLSPEAFSKGFIRQQLGDLSQREVFEQYAELFRTSQLIYVDGPKDGVFEAKLLDHFREFGLPAGTIIVFDDIRLWKMLSIWNGITDPKLDVTSFGHYTGTGIVCWEGHRSAKMSGYVQAASSSN